MKTNTLLLTAVLGLTSAVALGQTTIFQENFGTLDNGTAITTSNTGLTYVRIGNGGGSIQASNPSSFGPGASALITGPSGGSLNGLGVQNTLNFQGLDEISFELDFRISDASGTIVMGLGDGNSFTGDGTFNTSQGLFWLQANGLNFQRRAGSSWTTMTTLSLDTDYSLLVQANTTTNLMTVSLDGTAIASNVPVTTSGIDPTGFRVYSVNGSNVEIDNISITAIPEPGTIVMVGILGLAALIGLRRRK